MSGEAEQDWRYENGDDDDSDVDSDEGYADELDCTHCGGEGWQECPDFIQCTRPHNSLGECPCHACGGSGNRIDQTIF